MQNEDQDASQAEDEPFVSAVRKLQSFVTEREWQVLSLRHGLDGAHEVTPSVSVGNRPRQRMRQGTDFRTLEQVGDVIDVTRERIRQIEKKATKGLRHPARRALFSEAIDHQLRIDIPGMLDVPQEILSAALARYPEDFPYAERWMRFAAKLYPEIPQLQSVFTLLKEPKEWLDEEIERNGGSMHARDFAQILEEKGIAREEVNRVIAALYRSDSKYVWVDGAIVVPRYTEIARFILRRAGTSLHWREIYERAVKLDLGREIRPSALYNAIGANDLFVYRGPGTYGLREWGMEPKRYQREVLVGWFRESIRNATVNEIEHSLAGTEGEISHASITLYLGTHELFYEDVDGKFGLREWLPPPSEQRLDTPRHLREAPRSRKRLEKSRGD